MSRVESNYEQFGAELIRTEFGHSVWSSQTLDNTDLDHRSMRAMQNCAPNYQGPKCPRIEQLVPF